ncbi:hypothetical protein [uncultured Cyclobacterium sp.]|uniref:hypothetical protein n=1 Tax=uncultured Cyclobacterium sp. TaxID=453820 RepID=UPI0030EF240D|tara:strand:+ start:36740 stop:37114 length:375 start_codon:yes stop_codon:yes gene_type:complete
MRREIILWLGIGAISILIMTIPLIISQEDSHRLYRENRDNYLFESAVYKYENANSDTVSISISELPTSIQQVIKTDSLIKHLEIRTVKKISQNSGDYYDVCFKDTDYFNIMVMYDKNGIIVSQL